jgi:UDP-sulfoquinovose synthase
MDERLLPNFHYDDIFGTVVNRFLVQAVSGIPLTIYGKGGQNRGYLNLKDTLQCVELALKNPVAKGELRILNQFTEQLSVNEIAEKVYQVGNQMGLAVEKNNIPNPRQEKEEHYYNAKHHGLMELGLQPHYFTDEVIQEMLVTILKYKDRINKDIILPRVSW